MTTPSENESARSGLVRRYGPIVGIVVVVIVIAVVVTVAGKSKTTDTPVPVAAAAGDVPMTYQQAKDAGKEGATTWVDNCDKTTGRIMVPSVYAPPCLPKFSGNNGGATSQGVTADQINIVQFVPLPNSDAQALLSGNIDSPEAAAETSRKYIQMFDDLYETYGRRINYVRFEGTGAGQDAVAARADALSIIEQYHPFAVINGPTLTDAYAQEMARAKVLCIGCGGSSPDSFFQTHAPYIWNTLPTTEQLSVNLTDYIVNRVVGKKAEFAGDDLKGQTRKLGIVHFETDPPSYTELNDLLAKCGPRVGYSPAADEQYVFDIGKFPERATTIIAKMKAAGVTTVLFLGDFIMPRYLTTQATAQNYYPEWIVTGTALTDLSVFGRQYDQAQWKHAFGLSNLPLRLPREQNDSWRLHQWYWGTAPAAENTNGVLYSPIAEAMLGIHMAGPNLNPETFKKGMFNYPVSGGGPTTPQISYGDHGYFKLQDANTCDFTGPRPDYASYDDSVEIWWDTTASGADEQGKEGQGMMRYSDNGKRYAPGTMPKTDVHAFKVENSQTTLDQPAPADAPPQYPSPPRPG